MVVVKLDPNHAKERYRYNMGNRIRDVKVYDGQVYLLEDKQHAKLMKLIPKH